MTLPSSHSKLVRALILIVGIHSNMGRIFFFWCRNVESHCLVDTLPGMIILGGGVVKHHICNANLMRNGADFSVFINTGQEFDGSDSGARPDEAISWGKIKVSVPP